MSEARRTDRVPPFRLSVASRVELRDTDVTGVVYYGSYPAFVDRAVLGYRQHLGVPALGVPGHLFVVRAFQAEYHSSLTMGDEVEILVRAARLGRSSHTMALRVERARNGDLTLAVEAEIVLVGLARYGGEPTPIPDDIRVRMTEFEAG